MEKKLETQRKLDDTLNLTCTIENAQNTQGHTEYVIRIQRGFSTENCWHVTRRYSDFSSLHSSLQIANIELPLPPKKVFGNMDREFVAERQLGLQNYLNTLLVHPMLASCLLLKRFLDPNNYSINYQELSLQYVSMLVRSEPAWEVVEPMPRIGWRIRKSYFLIHNKASPKQKYILSWSDIGPDRYLDDKNMQAVLKALTSLKHPYIYPITFATASDSGGYVIQPLSVNGSLRDDICKSQLRHPFLKKYVNPKEYLPLHVNEIQIYGRQILEALKFLQDKGLPHGHLHTGNIILDSGMCKITELQNHVLGLPPYYRSFCTQLRKITSVEDINVYSFGHIIYEMAFGKPLLEPTCDNYPTSCSCLIKSVLESILTTEACKGGLPCVTDLLAHPLFRDVQLRPQQEKPSMKLSTQLKEALKIAQEKTEFRLCQDQRQLRQVKRISKAQAMLSSEDDDKKRKLAKKKLQLTNGGRENSRPESPGSNASTTSSASPIPRSYAPPPPPLPTDDSNGETQESVPIPDVSDNRAALLGSIASFKKGGLRKAVTNDKSVPIIQ